MVQTPVWTSMKLLIDRALQSLETPFAMRVFFLLSFLDSALLPIPVETLSLPMLAARRNPWPIAVWGTVASVLGGIAGYLIGYALLNSVGMWLSDLYGLTARFEELKSEADANLASGAWIVFVGAVAPIPFKLVTIAAGAIGFSFPLFLLVSSVGRGVRFAAFSLGFHFFGDELRGLLSAHLRGAAAVVLVVMVAGMAMILV